MIVELSFRIPARTAESFKNYLDATGKDPSERLQGTVWDSL